MMKKTAIALALSALCGGAMADITSDSRSNSSSGAASKSASAAQSNPTTTTNTNSSSVASPKNTAGASASPAQGQALESDITYAPSSTSYGSDLGDMVPSFVSPGLTAGSNPCALSVSASGVGAGFGFGVGWVYQDHECSVRENLRIVGGMLRKDGDASAQLVLKNYICQSQHGWNAMELAAMEGGNGNLRCRNERPGIGSYVKLRGSEGSAAGERQTTRVSSNPRPVKAATSLSKAPSGYKQAVNKCVNAPAGEYSNCMARAKKSR